VTVSERPVAYVPVDGPAIGLAAQAAVLAALAVGVGLGAAGWLAGAVFGLVTWGALGGALRRSGARAFGAANHVTLARATLVGGVTALTADALRNGLSVTVPIGVLVGLATVALVLDGVDGQVARRTSTETPLGARFDMEVDAALIMVLSVLVATRIGGWVLAIGALRYVFVAAARALPWLRGALPPRFGRKAVAAVQGVVLVVAASGLLPGVVAAALVGAALASLVWSFGRDVAWLWRIHRPATGHAGTVPSRTTPIVDGC
jgi:phosphatidylglycerophosphate synthase